MERSYPTREEILGALTRHEQANWNNRLTETSPIVAAARNWAEAIKWQRITASPEDNDVDEIVIHGVDIHLERMSDGLVWYALYRKGVDGRLMFWLTANRKGDLRTSVYWDGDPWPDVTPKVRHLDSYTPDGSSIEEPHATT